MRRLGLTTMLVCVAVLLASAACGTDDRQPPNFRPTHDTYDTNEPDRYEPDTNEPDRYEPDPYEPDPYEPPAPEPPAVAAASMPAELVGFWYREDVAGGGVKATRSYTFYPSAEYYYEQSLCIGSSCEVHGREIGSVVVEPGVLTLYPTDGGLRQTRYSIQREYATNDIQLWLHDAFGPGAADIYYLRG